MTILFYIGLFVASSGILIGGYGGHKDSIRPMFVGTVFAVIGCILGVFGYAHKFKKPSVKVGQVWLIGDEDPFKCDTVRVMRISHGHVKYVELKDLRTEEMMAELDSLLDAKGALLYSADYSSCSIEKFVIDGRRVK